MDNYIRPSELYKWTLNNLHTLSDDVQETILSNLQHLKWVPDLLEKLTANQREIFKLTLMKQLELETAPFCLMSISCIVYNLGISGVEVSDLENIINTCERVKQEMVKMLNLNNLIQ